MSKSTVSNGERLLGQGRSVEYGGSAVEDN